MLLIYIYKASAAIIIFLITFVTGKLTSKTSLITWRFYFAETLASGIFLGAAMFHMLPDAEQNFSTKLALSGYPWGHLLCVLSLLMLVGIEQLLSKNKRDDSNTPAPYIPISVLSLHSLLEGAALGISVNNGAALMIFIAIVAHKGLDSFALCTSMRRSALTQKHSNYILFIFSLMTPLGIILASSASLLLHSYAEQFFEAVFNAVAAGAFLYLATTHQINHRLHDNSKLHALQYLLAVSMGLALMALLAVWV